MLIINADDWGRGIIETDAALHCYKNERISSVTAMVFMEDSQRAAKIAIDSGITVGLHLNLDQFFTGKAVTEALQKTHEQVTKFLTSNRKYALLLYNPFLRKQFKDLFQAQFEEFIHLYGKEPSHIDGHHHMHLSTNMLVDLIIPRGYRVRTSFSFFPGEKDIFNKIYRNVVIWRLKRNYKVTDYFFALSQIFTPDRLEKIQSLSSNTLIEVMTHPANQLDYANLMGENFSEFLNKIKIGNYNNI